MEIGRGPFGGLRDMPASNFLRTAATHVEIGRGPFGGLRRLHPSGWAEIWPQSGNRTWTLRGIETPRPVGRVLRVLRFVFQVEIGRGPFGGLRTTLSATAYCSFSFKWKSDVDPSGD